MPLRRAVTVTPTSSLPSNTPWHDYALTQGLRWLYPLDGRVDGAGLPLNLVTGSAQSAPRFAENATVVTRRQRLVGDSFGYEWRAAPPRSSVLSYTPSNPAGELYLDSPAASQWCFGMTVMMPLSASLIGDGITAFNKSWMDFCSCRGFLLGYNHGSLALTSYNGSGDLFSRNLEIVSVGRAFRLGCRLDATNASQSEVYFNGYRFAAFNWNRSSTPFSSQSWTALGLLNLDQQQYGAGFSANDFWLVEGFQTKRFMELMGGY